MKSIMIDMDDVICEGAFLYHLNKFLGTSYTTKDLKGYYMQDLIPKESENEWNEYICKQNIYGEGCCFIDDAIETIEKLSKQYDVYIVTAYIFRDTPRKCGIHLYNKYECLCEKLSFLHPSRFVFCDAKHLIKCDIKIDDKLSNILENADMKLLFDAYHNRDITDEELEKLGVMRVCTWRDISALLLK